MSAHRYRPQPHPQQTHTPHHHPLPLRTVLSHIALPILMGLVMAAAYLGGFHRPIPHELPLAVVGPTTQVQPLADGLEEKLGDAVDVRVLDSRTEAEELLGTQEIAGAYLPGAPASGSNQAQPAELVVASGASETTVSVVEAIASKVALAQGVPLATSDVAPLTPDDPVGQNAFFVLVALTIGSYASAIAIGAAAASWSMPRRLGLAAGVALLFPTLVIALSRLAFGMFPGRVPFVLGLSVLYCAGVLLVGVGLHPLLGRWCTLVYSAVFVALNFTSSGGVFSPVLQPALFGWLHEFWIGAGYVEALRRHEYLPELSLAHPLGILGGWLLLGAVCVLLGSAWERRRAHSAASTTGHRHGEDELTDEQLLELEEDVAV